MALTSCYVQDLVIDKEENKSRIFILIKFLTLIYNTELVVVVPLQYKNIHDPSYLINIKLVLLRMQFKIVYKITVSQTYLSFSQVTLLSTASLRPMDDNTSLPFGQSVQQTCSKTSESPQPWERHQTLLYLPHFSRAPHFAHRPRPHIRPRGFQPLTQGCCSRARSSFPQLFPCPGMTLACSCPQGGIQPSRGSV